MAEFLGGVTGIIMGILALLGIAPLTLLSVAVLVLGATYLFSGLSSMASSSQGLMGVSALVLGILALIGLSPLVLVLAGLVCLGASALLHGAAIGARVLARNAAV